MIDDDGSPMKPKTVKELRAEAKALGVPRYSKMRKAELLEAIAAHVEYDPADNSAKSYSLAINVMRERARSLRREVIGDSVLYLGDALIAMSLLDTDSVSAVITDPPYCSGAATEAHKGSATHQGLRSETIKNQRFKWFSADNMTTSGLVWLMRSIAVESARIVDEKGSLLAFCDWRMSINLAPAMESGGWRLRNLCVWNKGHFGLGTGFRPQHELVIHLTKRAPEFHHAGYGNVLDCPRTTRAEQEHPTEKPLELMRALVEVVAPAGGAVLDPFMGSASTGVAAVSLGRKFIGVEVDPKYFDIACRRIEEAYRQPDMFIEAPQSKAEQLPLPVEA